MGEKKLEAGEYAYREGDTADAAYVVTAGKIELLETSDGREVLVNTLTAGSVFGEHAIFNPTALRLESARVLEAATLQSMTAEEFQAQFAQTPQPIQPFLQHAFDRMKATKVKAKASLADAVLEGSLSKITIAPASEKLKTQFKPVEIPIARLPFTIGGYPEGGTVSRRDNVHLSIAAQDAPLRVSRKHCEIAIENQGVVITDLGSRFGTRVNGAAIGAGRGNFLAPLKKGANEVILGAPDGPYKLTVSCE